MTNRILLAANGGNAALRSAGSANATAASWATAATTTFNNGSGPGWRALAYAPEINTAVQFINGAFSGNPTAGDMMYSTNQGASWTAADMGQRNTWQDCAWSPSLGLFAAISSDGTNRVATSPDGHTWTLRTAASASAWNGIAWSEPLGLFCAVGSSGAVMTSPDGTNWTTRTAAASKTWQRIVWCGGSVNKFAAVASGAGGSNEVMYSADGINWTAVSFSPGYSWGNIGWSEDLGQCIVIGGNTGIAYYSTNLTSWSSTTTGLGSDPWQGICWSVALQLWVICGGTSGNAVATSTNGTSWTAQTGIISGGGGWIVAVALEDAPPPALGSSSELEQDSSSLAFDKLSDDAASSDYAHTHTWNPADALHTNFSNNNLTVQSDGTAGYQGVRATHPHSSGKKYFEIYIDAIDQGNQFQLFGVGPADQAFTDFIGLYHGSNGNGPGFIQFGLHDGGGHFTMSNIKLGVAVDFRTRKVRFQTIINGYAGGWIGSNTKVKAGPLFPTIMWDDSGIHPDIPIPVAIGNFGAQPFVMAIPEGYVSWDGQQGAESGAAPIIAGNIVIAGTNGANATDSIIHANDPAFWVRTATALPRFDNLSAINFRALGYSPRLNRFVAIATAAPDTARQIITSDDGGATWTTRTSPANNAWESVVWSPELHLFVAVASSGTDRVMTSPDGTNWTTRTAAAANDWKSVAWSPALRLFAAVSNTGTGNRIMTSPDGINWTSRTSGADSAWNTIVWADGLSDDPSSTNAGTFFCLGGGGGGSNDIMASQDGVTWTARNSGQTYQFTNLCWSPDLGMLAACAVTGGGAVMYSTDGHSWGLSVPAGSNAFNAIAWSQGAGVFIVVGSDTILTSPDGVTWTDETSPAPTGYGWNSVLEGLYYIETPSSQLESFIHLQELSSDKAASDELLSEAHSSDKALHDAASSSDKPAHDAASSDRVLGSDAAASSEAAGEAASSSDVALASDQGGTANPSVEGGDAASSDAAQAERDSSDRLLAEEVSSDMRELVSEGASSDLQDELRNEIPPPIQVVVILSS